MEKSPTKPTANKQSSKSSSPDQPTKPVKPSLSDQISTFLGWLKSNMSLVFAVIAVALIGYTFVTISSILGQSDDPDYRQEQAEKGIRSSFDQKTIDKIENLHTSNDPSSIQLPSGRINPFIE